MYYVNMCYKLVLIICFKYIQWILWNIIYDNCVIDGLGKEYYEGENFSVLLTFQRMQVYVKYLNFNWMHYFEHLTAQCRSTRLRN